jgi:hypothetical protein
MKENEENKLTENEIEIGGGTGERVGVLSSEPTSV